MTPLTPDRRQMLSATARSAAAIGLTILSGGLLARRLTADECGNDLPCEKCRIWQNCDLPPALVARSKRRRAPEN